MRLIGELASRGSSRAVDLAKIVGEPANSVSFHLRQLARYGLVVDDPDRGTDGRERWWRMASDQGFSVNLSELRTKPGGEAAVQLFEKLTEDNSHALLSVAYRYCNDSPEGPRAWLNDFGLHLTREELEEFLEEQWQLMMRWMERSRELAASGDGAERHTYFGMAFGAPLDEVMKAGAPSPDEAAE